MVYWILQMICPVVFLMFAAPATAAEKEATQQPKEIHLEITTSGEPVRARIKSIKKEAIGTGFELLELWGKVTSTRPLGSDKKTLEIVWDKAHYNNNTAVLNSPFETGVTVLNQLDQGDVVPAQGDLQSLVQAWAEVVAPASGTNIAEEEAQKERTSLDNQSSSGAGAGVGLRDNVQRPDVPSLLPNLSVAPDAVVTTERCGVDEDIANERVLIKERTLQDGDEISSCTANPLREIKLHREYSQCSVLENFETQTVTPRYKLSWTDPDTGATSYAEEGNCFVDQDKAQDFIYSSDGCALRPDFGRAVSEQLVKISYIDNGAPKLLRDCDVVGGQSIVYPHLTTRDGCDPIVHAGSVTFQSRQYILIDEGITQTVAECAPESGGSVPVIEEVCSGHYDHDIGAGVSYQMVKRYYEDEDGNPVYLNGTGDCIRSQTLYTHFSTGDGCAPDHDDVSRKTQYYERNFITLSNDVTAAESERIYITPCLQVVTGAVPYTVVGNRWHIKSQGFESLVIRDNAFSYSGHMHTIRSDLEPIGIVYSFSNGDFSSYLGGFKVHWPDDQNPITVSGTYRYAPGNVMPPVWEVSSGRILNQSLSNGQPSNWTGSINCISGGGCGSPIFGQRDPAPRWLVEANPPQCTVTRLESHPVFIRGDGSEYEDGTVVAGQLDICGDGSHLDGVVE